VPYISVTATLILLTLCLDRFRCKAMD